MKTKERILTEALKLFAKRGYEAVSVAEIADAVGIKAPSLYKHYESKREIFKSIIERVNEADSDNTKEYSMPEGVSGERADGGSPKPEEIIRFSKAMFLYWTTDDFARNFRRVLTIEQYNGDEMSKLYANYFSEGPTEYMTEIFAKLTASRDTALAAAIEFFAPMHLMYSLCDAGESAVKLSEILEKHSAEVLEKYAGCVK